MAGSRQPERDVNGVEHDGHLCRPMQRLAAMSCVEDKNLNATEVHRELVTVEISESLAQLQELQQSSCLHDLLVGVSSHELATCEGAELNFFEQGQVCPSVVECPIPQVMGLIGIMLVGSLTALNSSVVLPVKNSRGGAPHLGFYGVQKSENQLQSEILLFLSNYTIRSIFPRVSPPPPHPQNWKFCCP